MLFMGTRKALLYQICCAPGFHVDDSEVTLNVCLGKEFEGGELFFRGVRCEKHVNGEARPEVGRGKYQS